MHHASCITLFPDLCADEKKFFNCQCVCVRNTHCCGSETPKCYYSKCPGSWPVEKLQQQQQQQ